MNKIVFQNDCLRNVKWISSLKEIARSFVIITDDCVGKLYGEKLLQLLPEAHMIVVPRGEQSKSRERKAKIEDEMQELGMGRDCGIIALGGGVVSDLAGFVAATYCRGIPFICIPTTLLAQVDASLGGKVAINTDYGKNLIGAFYQPEFVLIDTDLPKTCSDEEMLNGMAEVVKYAVIHSPSLFKRLEEGVAWEEVVEECCDIKNAIVKQDPEEKSVRRILNFGHTVAHALETYSNYTLPHGKAVAMGMHMECCLSVRLGFLDKDEQKRVSHLLEKMGFSLKIPLKCDVGALISHMKLDKKALNRSPRFVLLGAIGEVVSFEGAYCTHVDENTLREVLECL